MRIRRSAVSTGGLLRLGLVAGLVMAAAGQTAIAAETAGAQELLVAQAERQRNLTPGQRRALRRSEEQSRRRNLRQGGLRQGDRGGQGDLIRQGRDNRGSRTVQTDIQRRGTEQNDDLRRRIEERRRNTERGERGRQVERGSPNVRRDRDVRDERRVPQAGAGGNRDQADWRRNPNRDLKINPNRDLNRDLNRDVNRGQNRDLNRGPNRDQADWRRDRRERFQDWRRGRKERFEQRRRERRERQLVRRTDRFLFHRRSIRDRFGRERFVNSRRYWVRDGRYRNRFRGGRSIYWVAPVGVAIAAGAYVVLSSAASYDDYYTTFMAPPVRRIDRRYTLDEVVSDPEVRSSMRSVDVDVVNFASGSDEVPESQMDRLEDLANAILATLKKRPKEVFLIEGYTDATGSDEDNLDLSERRAAAVQEILVSEFGVPAENLESVGYGEQYLLIETDGSESRNRRVVLRAVGSLLAER